MKFRNILIFFGVTVFGIEAQSKSGSVSVDHLFSIGYHQLFLSQRGLQSATVTIVFESGAGGSSKDCEKVISLLPSTVQTIAYDRGGIVKSDAGP